MNDAGRATKEEIDTARKALREAEDDYRTRVKGAATDLAVARRDYERAVKDRRASLQQAETAYADQVRGAERQAADAARGDLLARYGALQLYDNRLESPDGVVELSPAIRASVDVAGQKTDKIDNREVTLLLDT